jgi:hypothetical protein
VSTWGALWLDHAPAETQNYVSSILGRVGAYAPTAMSWKPLAVLAGVGLGLWYLVEEFS